MAGKEEVLIDGDFYSYGPEDIPFLLWAGVPTGILREDMYKFGTRLPYA